MNFLKPLISISTKLRTALVTTSAVFFFVPFAGAATSGPPKLPADAPTSASTSASTSAAKISPAASDEELVAREKRRLEELFIWKMSEELKLPVETEGSFAEAIRSLNREKAKANVAVAEALNAIDKAQNSDRAKSKKEIEKAVKLYESAWRQYGALPLREVSRLRAILGPEKLGRYLVAKSVMAEKLTALSVGEASGSGKKEAPKSPTPKTTETK